ncbi:MAG: hypothetical protein ACI8RD_013721, partial [Bacillariaceae sp.]
VFFSFITMYQTEVKPIAIMDEDFEGKLKGNLRSSQKLRSRQQDPSGTITMGNGVKSTSNSNTTNEVNDRSFTIHS